jgi:hypothetical protein
MAEALESAVNLLEGALRLLASEPVHGFGYEEVDQRDEHEAHESAELEDDAPVLERELR